MGKKKSRSKKAQLSALAEATNTSTPCNDSTAVALFIKVFHSSLEVSAPEISQHFSPLEQQAIAEMFVKEESMSNAGLSGIGNSLDAIKNCCTEKSAQPIASTILLALALASLLELRAVRILLRRMVNGMTLQEIKAIITRAVIQKAQKKPERFISSLENLLAHFEVAADCTLPQLILEAFTQVKISVSGRLEANSNNNLGQLENVTSTNTNEPHPKTCDPEPGMVTSSSTNELHPKTCDPEPGMATSSSTNEPGPKSCDHEFGMAPSRDGKSRSRRLGRLYISEDEIDAIASTEQRTFWREVMLGKDITASDMEQIRHWALSESE